VRKIPTTSRVFAVIPAGPEPKIQPKNSALMKRISILTASFGEGHNTAARNIRDALLAESPNETEVEICDLYQRTNPKFNRSMQVGYSVAINRFPRIWAGIFGIIGIRGLLEFALPTLAALREAMRSHFQEFQPDLIVSTYPIYSFLVKKIRSQSPFLRAPLVTIITDSTRINSAWYRCPSDALVVADKLTAGVLEHNGIDSSIIHTLGFPVSPRFGKLQTIPPDQPGPPHKLLYFPSTRKRHTIACLGNLLRLPGVEVTVITGRYQELHQGLCRAGFDHTPHVRLIGWTDQMPELLAASHLFIGKAGGAIVQEAIAAGVPFLVSHVVPGQEEGNLSLIEQLNIGRLASGSPKHLAGMVEEVFANDGVVWREWKANLVGVSRPHAARDIAHFLLSL